MFNKRNLFTEGTSKPSKKIKLSFSDDELETVDGPDGQDGQDGKTLDPPSLVRLPDLDNDIENDAESDVSFKPIINGIKFKKNIRRKLVVEKKKSDKETIFNIRSDNRQDVKNEARKEFGSEMKGEIRNNHYNHSLSELANQERQKLEQQYTNNKDNDSTYGTDDDNEEDIEIDRDWYMQDEIPSNAYFNQYDMDEEFENNNEPTIHSKKAKFNNNQYDEVDNSFDIFVHRAIPPFLDEATILSKNQQLITIIKDKSGDLYNYSKNGSTLVNERRKLSDRKNNSIDRVNNKNTSINKIINDESDGANKNNNSNKNYVADSNDSGDDEAYDPEKVKNQRKSLPAYKIKDEAVKIINENQVIIIVGETGSGKTTQLPQFLFEEGYHNHGIIGITQPRRVAAISVANRVSDEMSVRLGNEVGYSIRFEDKTTSKTKIKFMTDGILLRETLLDNELNKYSCIIMDEAHERSLNTDILFGIFKKILVKRRDLKLIITSATMNSLKFSKFFGNAIQFTIPGKIFPVDILFQSIPSIDYVDSSIKQILKLHLSNTPGDILVFMTGQEDIETTCELLGDELDKLIKIDKSIKHLEILPIYSTLSTDLQSKIFKKNLKYRKCIIATNIAETSLTIDGIKFVIDTGLMKIKFYNPKLNMDSLQIAPISLAQANQRSGRAGRTGPGKCFRLYTLSSSVDEMFTEPIPEIQRTNLNNTILLLKSLNIKNLNNFPFLDKPSIESISTAQYNLWSIGALDNFGNLTNLGKKMSKFPIDPTLSKLLIISTLNNFRCSKEILIIVSMLSIPPIFERPMNDKNLQKKSDQTREKFQIVESDHLTLLNIFTQFLKNNKNEKWCKQNFLHYKSLKRAVEIFNQLNVIMKSSNLEIESNDDWDKIRECISCSFFQNAAEFKKYGEYQQLRSGLLMFLHPTSSLYGMGDLPKFIVYHELLMTGQKQYMNYVTSVEGKWLVDYGNVFYSKRIKSITSKENQLLKQKKFNELIESEKKNL